MNMLRVWGSGFYEEERLYDLCDRYGILVWQDFVFSCSIYPDDETFFGHVRVEALENVHRLRHRASLALWCGNNEMEWGWVEWQGMEVSLHVTSDLTDEWRGTVRWSLETLEGEVLEAGEAAMRALRSKSRHGGWLASSGWR